MPAPVSGGNKGLRILPCLLKLCFLLINSIQKGEYQANFQIPCVLPYIFDTNNVDLNTVIHKIIIIICTVANAHEPMYQHMEGNANTTWHFEWTTILNYRTRGG